MSKFPVYKRVIANGTTTEDIRHAISVEWGEGVDIATALYLEWKGLLLKSEIKSDIIKLLFMVIVTPCLHKWLYKWLYAHDYTLVPQEFEDWISEAKTKIWMGKNYDPKKGPYLLWAFMIAKHCWMDKFRQAIRENKIHWVSYDVDALDEYQVNQPASLYFSETFSSNPEFLSILADTKAYLQRIMPKRSDEIVLEAIDAGIQWHKSADIAYFTGLSLRQVNKSKARIKRVLENFDKN